jgi:hypothetical protein
MISRRISIFAYKYNTHKVAKVIFVESPFPKEVTITIRG